MDVFCIVPFYLEKKKTIFIISEIKQSLKYVQDKSVSLGSNVKFCFYFNGYMYLTILATISWLKSVKLSRNTELCPVPEKSLRLAQQCMCLCKNV